MRIIKSNVKILKVIPITNSRKLNVGDYKVNSDAKLTVDNT
jgi:hypothetical protein